MDQDLRALERRWRESRNEQDFERYVAARARSSGRPVEWYRFQEELRSFEPGRVEAVAREVLDAAHAAGTPPARPELGRRYQEAVTSAAGTWFPGLSDGWAPAWCLCHTLAVEADQASSCVSVTLGQVRAVHAFWTGLVGVAELEPAPGEDRSELARRQCEAVVDLLLEATGCNDAWYQELVPALRRLAQAEPEDVRVSVTDAFEELVEARFSSWVAPSAEARVEVAAAFGALYAPPDWDLAGDEDGDQGGLF